MTVAPLARPLPDPPPPLLVRAALRLRSLLLAAADALLPAPLAVADRAFGVARTAALATVVRLGIADLLAAGPQRAETLAAATGSQADALSRLLRGCVAHGVFALDTDGRFRHNRLSQTLRRDQPLGAHGMCRYFGSLSNVACWLDLDRTVASGKSAFARVHGQDVWSWLAAHPDEDAAFAQAMQMLTAVEAPWVARLYPWHEISTVCDLGGGTGLLLSELCLRHGHLRGILVDQAAQAEAARELAAARGVAARLEVRVGSYRDPLPAPCDAYLLKNVLHDWDDDTARSLLAHCRQALGREGRVLVVETLLEAAFPGPSDGRDLQMMLVTGDGRERTLEQYRELFASAGLRLGRSFRSPVVAVLEGRSA
jgi:hypothetical protein